MFVSLTRSLPSFKRDEALFGSSPLPCSPSREVLLFIDRPSLRTRYLIVFKVLLPSLQRLHDSEDVEQEQENNKETDTRQSDGTHQEDPDTCRTGTGSSTIVLQLSVLSVLHALNSWTDSTSHSYLMALIIHASHSHSIFPVLLLSTLVNAPLYSHCKRQRELFLRVLLTALCALGTEQWQILTRKEDLVILLINLLNSSPPVLPQRWKSFRVSCTHFSVVMSTAFVQHLSLFSLLFQEAISKVKLCSLFWILTSCCKEHLDNIKVQSALIKLFDQQILASKDPALILSAQLHLSPWLRTLHRLDEVSQFMAHLERLAKRDSGAATKVVSDFCTRINIDMYLYRDFIMRLVTDELVHIDLDRRQGAIDLANVFFTTLLSSETKKEIYEQTLQLLNTCRSSNLSAAVRASHCDCVVTLLKSEPCSSVQRVQLSLVALDTGLPLMTDSNTPAEVKVSLGSLLSCCLVSLISIDKKLVDAIWALTHKPGSAPFAMAIFDVLTFPQIEDAVYRSFLDAISNHIDALQEHICNAAIKPALAKREGFLYVALLAQSLSTGILMSNKSVLKALVSLFTDPLSFINLPSLLDSLREEDCPAASRFVFACCRLLSNPNVLSKSSEPSSFQPIYQTVVRLSTHSTLNIHRRTCEMLQRLYQEKINETFVGLDTISLVRACQSVLVGKALKPPIHSSAWCAAFRILFRVPSTSPLSAFDLAAILHLCSDPSLYNEQHFLTKPSSLFHHMCTLATFAVIEEAVPDLSQLIFGSSGFASSDLHQFHQAATLFAWLFAAHPGTFKDDRLRAPFVALLTSPTLLQMGEYETAVYNTAEGTLCQYQSNQLFTTPAETKNVKGRTKQDDEFARLQKEIDRKKGKIDADTKAKLESQSKLRNSIRKELLRTTVLLDLVASMTEQSYTHSLGLYLLESLLPALYTLKKQDLLSAHVQSTHLALLRSLDSFPRCLSWPLSVTVLATATVNNNPSLWEQPTLSVFIKDTLTALITKGCQLQRSLSPSSWLYVLPVVQYAMYTTEDSVLDEEDSIRTDEDDLCADGNANDNDAYDQVEVKISANGVSTNSSLHNRRLCFAHSFELTLTIVQHLSNTEVFNSSCTYCVQTIVKMLLHVLNHVSSSRSRASKALESVALSMRYDDCKLLLDRDGIFACEPSIRLAALAALTKCTSLAQELKRGANMDMLVYRLWICSFDSDAIVSNAASLLLQELSFIAGSDYMLHVQPLLSYPEHHVRQACAKAITAGLAMYPNTIGPSLASLLALFEASSKQRITKPSMAFRSAAQTEVIDMWETRHAIAMCFVSYSTLAIDSKERLLTIITFILNIGLRDTNVKVREELLRAGVALVQNHGSSAVAELLPLFTTYASPVDDTEDLDEQWRRDRVREGAVVLLGSVAQHLSPDSDKLLRIVDALIEVLRTPSLIVQKSVSECLCSLMTQPAIVEHAQKYLDLLLERLRTGEDYGERRGAAFGLASSVKGLKLAALKKYGILDRIKMMVDDKSSAKARQGALFAYERLFTELGAKFEPYILSILPSLLSSFGDQNNEVREAAQECAQEVMSHLTTHGVKMVLPLVLGALQEPENKQSRSKPPDSVNSATWRNKQEAISMLGTLSHCAPQQLSTALPQIVPRLLEVMTDPNVKLQTSAKQALKQIGSVIRNPEILVLVPVLLAALNDPSQHTKRALSDLMGTAFVHSVDPPSLALIVPIVKKGLKGRNAPIKKMAAQVVGSMCSLIDDVKNILPYATSLLKQLKEALYDPIPEVRSVAARALGSLYAGIKQEKDVDDFSTLVEDLLNDLSADTNNVQRSGAAQGLAQVLAVDGTEKMRQVLPRLFSAIHPEKSKPMVREGIYELFAALPDAYPLDDLASFLPEILPVVVQGLADDNTHVRDGALAAGQSLVLHYASTQTELLLPALEEGLIADDWRIRQSSVHLLGLLLLRVAGLSGKYLLGVNADILGDDDENIKDATTITSKEQEQEIEIVMGTERRNRMFALIYLLRSDVIVGVRETAWRVWKGLVVVTPRMLNLILPTLMNRIIFDLASSSTERQAASGMALGDLVVKMGDQVLTSILPILQSRLNSDNERTRQGVCLGLAEVVRHVKKSEITAFEITAAIREALCDESALVRDAAGKAFQVLYKQNGKKVLDEVVPALVNQLFHYQKDMDATSRHIEGVKQLLECFGDAVMSLVMPLLTAEPISLFQFSTLAALSEQMTRGLGKYVTPITLSFLRAFAEGIDNVEQMKLLTHAFECVVPCITADSTQVFLETLCSSVHESEASSKRIAGARLFSLFSSHSKICFDSHLPLILQSLLPLWNDDNEEVVLAGWDSMETLCKSIPDDRMSCHIEFIRSVINGLIEDRAHSRRDSSYLPGCVARKGPAPLLPAFQYALLHGSVDMRITSAQGLCDLIHLSTPATLSSHVIKIAGPLIRIVGDRFPGELKAAILQALDALILKNGVLLKPFLPQLQSTFLKAIQDSSASTRYHAATALSHLMAHTPLNKVEALLQDLMLMNGFEHCEPEAKQSVLLVVCNVCKLYPSQLNVRRQLQTSCQRYLFDETYSNRKQAGDTYSQLLCGSEQSNIDEAIHALCAHQNQPNWLSRSGSSLALAYCCRRFPESLNSLQLDLTDACVLLLSESHKGVQADAMLFAREMLSLTYRMHQLDCFSRIAKAILPVLEDETTSSRHAAASTLGFFAQQQDKELPLSILELLVPSLLGRMSDSNSVVKTSSEIALYHLFSFGLGTEVAEKVINAYGSRLLKAGTEKATLNAMVVVAKRTLMKLDASVTIRDDLTSNSLE